MLLKIEWDPEWAPEVMARLIEADIAFGKSDDDLVIYLKDDQSLVLHPGDHLEVDLGSDTGH